MNQKNFILLILFTFSIRNLRGDTNDEVQFNLNDGENDNTNNNTEIQIIQNKTEIIYSMNSTKEFDLNIKINGTKQNTLMILFYSSGCIHCKHFHPIYKLISEALINNTNIKLSKIELLSAKGILKKYSQIRVPGVPMIYFYKNGNFIRYEGKRNQEEIISFINRIHNFECTEILSINELNKYINFNTIFSLDKKNQFILGLFKNKTNNKNNENLDKSFIINNFMELNSLNNDILLNKNCYYYFYDDKKDNNNINNYYLNSILNNNINNDNYNNNNYLIYSYNYQKGLNTFSLFNYYLNFRNNSSKINDININNHIKIIQNKYKSFIDDYYLYKYYYINETSDLNKFIHHNKKFFIFNYKDEDLHKLYINEINYILSINASLSKDYMFILLDINNINKINEKEGISFYDADNFSPNEIIKRNELNKTNILSKIFEYIYKDKNNLIESQFESSKKFVTQTINSVFNWILKLTNYDNTTNNSLLNNFNKNKEIEEENNTKIDYEQELIDEINKTIIEDNKNKEKENKENINKNINIDINRIKKRRKNLELFKDEEELGFNKNLILFPFYLILYSFLYYFFYKYVFLKYQNRIYYKRLPTDDFKNI